MATQLRNLNVSHNALASLRGIEQLTNLRLLRCHGNSISDLSYLTSLPSLTELWVSDNHIETPQIAYLAAIRSLQTLVLHPNPCTNATNYVSYVVKTVPWLLRVDRVEVDDALRQQSQHVNERAFLSSAATDVSEISLMTSRSDGGDAFSNAAEAVSCSERVETPESRETVNELPRKQTALPPTDKQVLATPSVEEPVTEPKKKKKMTAEDFMRAFPVQDFIPQTESAMEIQNSTNEGHMTAVLPGGGSGDADCPPLTSGGVSNHDAAEETPVAIQRSFSHTSISMSPDMPAHSVSAISNAVLTLPSFDGDSIFQKKKPIVAAAAKSQKKPQKKAPQANKNTVISPPDPALAAFQQREWTLSYPNSTVNAIHIRSDGSALAKWPNGSVAISIDRERDGFRCYAAHKDGAIALSFDADGVGFINYYPSGRMMISTSSSGDGLYFSNDGCTILRQWDAQLVMKNEKWESTESLCDDQPDGVLLSRLSDGLGIRLGLQRDASRPCAVRLTILFASGTGIRHGFVNWINAAESTSAACDVEFGKEPPKAKKKASGKPTHSHHDTLDGIRAAVAKLG